MYSALGGPPVLASLPDAARGCRRLRPGPWHPSEAAAQAHHPGAGSRSLRAGAVARQRRLRGGAGRRRRGSRAHSAPPPPKAKGRRCPAPAAGWLPQVHRPRPSGASPGPHSPAITRPGMGRVSPAPGAPGRRSRRDSRARRSHRVGLPGPPCPLLSATSLSARPSAHPSPQPSGCPPCPPFRDGPALGEAIGPSIASSFAAEGRTPVRWGGSPQLPAAGERTSAARPRVRGGNAQARRLVPSRFLVARPARISAIPILRG